jgi:hypothetical protein
MRIEHKVSIALPNLQENKMCKQNEFEEQANINAV